MALHRYWRLLITQSTSGSDQLISLYEVEWRATPGGPDQCNGGSATASHNTATAYRLFDNNSSSYWTNGGPGVESWIQYDFGAGVTVDVGEIRLLPRSGLAAPKAFALHHSDEGSVWTETAHWTDVTDWISGVEKFFVPPPVWIASASNQPFALLLAMVCRQPYRVGEWGDAACRTPYALWLEVARNLSWEIVDTTRVRALTHGFSLWVEGARPQPFNRLLEADNRHPWEDSLSRALRHPLWERVQQSGRRPWSVHERVEVGHRQPMGITGWVAGSRPQRFCLLERNGVGRRLTAYWNLATQRYPIIPQPPLLTLASPGHENARPLSARSAVIRHAPDQWYWSAELHLAREIDWVAMGVDEPFVLQVGGESFALLVNGKRLQRTGDGSVACILYGVSPTARSDLPRAGLISRTWTADQSARSVVEELLGESVVWRLPDWSIPAGRLVVRNRPPIVIVQQIAEAAGGVAETTPAGQWVVRPRFPLSVPDWPTAVPDHLWTDVEDILAIDEQPQVKDWVDQVIVRNGPVAGQTDGDWDQISIRPDRRLDGPNQGRTRFFPGETAHVVLTPGSAAAGMAVTASTGERLPGCPTVWQQTEDVAFRASNQAQLTIPTAGIVSFLWLGNGLGDPVVQGDGITLVVPVVGTAVARITYEVVAMDYTVPIPQPLAGQDPSPVLVTAVGQSLGVGVLEIPLMQRGEAIHPVREVVAPLLSHANLLSCRARAELDRGSIGQTVDLTIWFRPGLTPGQLVEVQDGGYGGTFRGLIVGVSHEMDVNRWVSRLTVWR